VKASPNLGSSTSTISRRALKLLKSGASTIPPRPRTPELYPNPTGLLSPVRLPVPPRGRIYRNRSEIRTGRIGSFGASAGHGGDQPILVVHVQDGGGVGLVQGQPGNGFSARIGEGFVAQEGVHELAVAEILDSVDHGGP
jgi:hypothetical protein